MKLKHWLETTSPFNTESVFIYLSNLNGFINILTSISRNMFLEVGWNPFTIQGWSMLGELCSSFKAVVRLSAWIPLFDCKKWNAVLEANIGCLLNIVEGSCKWVRHLNIIYPPTHNEPLTQWYCRQNWSSLNCTNACFCCMPILSLLPVANDEGKMSFSSPRHPPKLWPSRAAVGFSISQMFPLLLAEAYLGKLVWSRKWLNVTLTSWGSIRPDYYLGHRKLRFDIWSQSNILVLWVQRSNWRLQILINSRLPTLVKYLDKHRKIFCT